MDTVTDLNVTLPTRARPRYFEFRLREGSTAALAPLWTGGASLIQLLNAPLFDAEHPAVPALALEIRLKFVPRIQDTDRGRRT